MLPWLIVQYTCVGKIKTFQVHFFTSPISYKGISADAIATHFNATMPRVLRGIVVLLAVAIVSYAESFEESPLYDYSYDHISKNLEEKVKREELNGGLAATVHGKEHVPGDSG